MNKRLAIGIALVVILGIIAAFLLLKKMPSGSHQETTQAGAAREMERARASKSWGTPQGEQAPPPNRDELQLVEATATVIDGGSAQDCWFDGKVVTAETDAPVPDAIIVFNGPSKPFSIGTDHDGRFHFVPEELGSYALLSVAAPGHRQFNTTDEQTPVRLSAEPGVQLNNIVLRLHTEVGLTLHVVNEQQQPIAGAQISASFQRVTTDAKGVARMNLSQGDPVTVIHPGFAAASETVTPELIAQQRMWIVLRARNSGAIQPHGEQPRPRAESHGPHALHGFVSRGSDGAPVAAFTVVIAPRTGPLSVGRSRTASFVNGNGEFQINDLAAGPHQVSVIARGYAPSEAHNVTIANTTEPTDIDVSLRSGAEIRGFVIDRQDHHPIAGAMVTLEGRLMLDDESSSVRLSARADDEGKFTISGAPPGVTSLVTVAPGYTTRITSGINVVTSSMVLVQVDLEREDPNAPPRLEIEGIGAGIGTEGDALVIKNIIEGGGAQQAGLVAGDLITKVDQEPVVNLGFPGAIQRIRGPAGTSVLLHLKRAGNREMDVRVLRVRISR